MKQINCNVDTDGDGQTSVWTASSADVPGLATEADTLGAVAQKLRDIIPQRLPLQGVISSHHKHTVSFDLISHRQELIEMVGKG